MSGQVRVWATTNDGQIEIVSLTSERVEETLQVINTSFYPYETIRKLIQLANHPEAIKELEILLHSAIKDGVSLIAIEKTSGKIVGVSLNKIFTIEDEHDYYGRFASMLTHPVSQLFLRVINGSCEVVNYCKAVNVDCLMEAKYVTIVPKFRGNGLASLLVTCAIRVATCLKNGENVKVGINGKLLPLGGRPQIVTGVFTSPFTQKMGEKLGFVRLAKLPLKSLAFLRECNLTESENATIAYDYKTL